MKKKFYKEYPCNFPVSCSKISDNDKFLATGHCMSKLSVWDIKNEIKLFQKTLEDAMFVRCISFSPDSKYVFCCAHNGNIYQICIENGSLIKSMKCHIFPAIFIKNSLCGNYLYSIGSED